MANDLKIPPPITDFWKWLAFHLAQDWRHMLEYPLKSLAIFATSIIVAWVLTWKVVVPEKNEQLSSKQGEIESKQSLIDLLNKELEQSQKENESMKSSSTNYYFKSAIESQTNTLSGTIRIGKSSNKPRFDLYLNYKYITNGIVIPLQNDRKLFFEIFNVGTEIATNMNFTFFAPFDRTNFIFDLHWIVNQYSQRFPINHKMYDWTDVCSIQMTAINPIPTEPLKNGFDVTAFTISPLLQPVSHPVELMKTFGNMLDSSEIDGDSYSIPIKVTVKSDESETNECFIFLKP